MSRSNRDRRADKQWARRRTSAHREGSAGCSSGDPGLVPGVIIEFLHAGAAAYDAGDACAPEDCAGALVAEFGPYGRDLERAADQAVTEAVERAWRGGWMPADMPELGRRHLDPSTTGYLVDAVLAQCRRYASATLHPRWRRQLAELSGTDEPGTGGADTLAGWSERHRIDRVAALAMVIRVLDLLWRLPQVEPLVPLPGRRCHTTAAPIGEAAGRALAKVRALLAKAESTEFPDEAEALSAKAQELMRRHALQQAMLDHDSGRPASAEGRRLWLDAPYAGAKALLADVIATANRCRAVWSEKPGFVTVIGTEADLDGVELLTTSLLVQANRAMLAAGRSTTRSGMSRTRSFRQSFLVAFATRIGERMREASEAGAAELAEDPRLLPVLAARDQAVDDRTAQLFPQVTTRGFRVSNAAGWGAGRAAADLALFDDRRAVAG